MPASESADIFADKTFPERRGSTKTTMTITMMTSTPMPTPTPIAMGVMLLLLLPDDEPPTVVVQVLPVHADVHAHVYDPCEFVHVPPFLQGLEVTHMLMFWQ